VFVAELFKINERYVGYGVESHWMETSHQRHLVVLSERLYRYSKSMKHPLTTDADLTIVQLAIPCVESSGIPKYKSSKK
jgi:hypothetical protein